MDQTSDTDCQTKQKQNNLHDVSEARNKISIKYAK